MEFTDIKTKRFLLDTLTDIVEPEIRELRGIAYVIGDSIAYSPNELNAEMLMYVFEHIKKQLEVIENNVADIEHQIVIGGK